MANTTFKGPQYYEEGDKEKFRGRDKETGELFYLVGNNDFSVCYAESGEGKSSLINAGLCPKLRESGMFPVRVRFDKFDEKFDFDAFVWHEFVRETKEARDRHENYKSLDIYPYLDINEVLSVEPLWRMLQTYELRLNSYETLTPVFIFDQFEEVFARPKDISWTKEFFEWLEDLYNHRDLMEDSSLESPRNSFKVLLSLRSEYVCELDYWSMSQRFIPSLKNNRYFLKSLTKNAAEDVISLGEGIFDIVNKDELLESVKAKRIEHLPSGEKDKDKIPCISALLLSLILSELEGKDEELLTIIKDTHSDKKIFSRVLDYIYEKAIKESNFDENSTKILEDNLIDGFGNRKKAGKRELASIPESCLKKLEDKRIINKVADYYEISHDSICSIMNEKKKERQKKEIESLKTQKENILISSFLSLFTIFAIWFLTSIICDENTFNFFFEAKEHAKVLSISLMISNLIVIPLIIASTIKRLHFSIWISLLCLSVNVLCVVYYNDIISRGPLPCNIMLALAIVIPILILLYSIKSDLYIIPPKKEYKIVITSLLLYFLVILIYVFILSVFNTAHEQIPLPAASSWGIFVLPMLVHFVISIFINKDIKIICICIFGFLLALLALNTLLPYILSWSHSPFVFSFVQLLMILLGVLLCIAWSYKSSAHRWLGVAEYALILVVLVLNLGFLPIRINYDKVNHVCNWKEVVAHDDSMKYGICSPISGNTIYPFVFEEITSGGIDKYCYIKTNAFSTDTTSTATITKDRHLIEIKNNKGMWGVLHHPCVGFAIWEKNKKNLTGLSEDEKINVLAAKTFFELLHHNISFFKTGSTYSIDSIKSFPELYRLQKDSLCNILDRWHGWINEKNLLDNLDERNLAEFNQALARTFYLNMIKDRILKKDSVELFTLHQHLLTLYFPDLFVGNFFFKHHSILEIGNRKEYDVIYKLNCKSLSFLNADMWRRYIQILMRSDMYINYNLYTSSMDALLNSLNDVIDNMDNIVKRGIKGNNFSILSILKEKPEYNQIKNNLKTEIEKIVKRAEGEKADDDFQELNVLIYSVLSQIVNQERECVYNNEFEVIMELMFGVSAYRLCETKNNIIKTIFEIEKSKIKHSAEIYTQMAIEEILLQLRTLAANSGHAEAKKELEELVSKKRNVK